MRVKLKGMIEIKAHGVKDELRKVVEGPLPAEDDLGGEGFDRQCGAPGEFELEGVPGYGQRAPHHPRCGVGEGLKCGG